MSFGVSIPPFSQCIEQRCMLWERILLRFETLRYLLTTWAQAVMTGVCRDSRQMGQSSWESMESWSMVWRAALFSGLRSTTFCPSRETRREVTRSPQSFPTRIGSVLPCLEWQSSHGEETENGKCARQSWMDEAIASPSERVTK